ncbi:hypothetical protein T4D_4865, partial [Trichinella pseudospiralis]
MIKRKLPPDTLEAWRAFVQDMTDEQITSVAFLSFLLKQTRIKGSARRRSPRKLEQKSTKGERFTTATVQVEPVGKCLMCSGIHPVEKCPRFVNLSVPERWQCVRKRGLCFGCLQKGHRKGNCQQNPVGTGQHPLLALENFHSHRTPWTAPSRGARSAAQPDAAAKEKAPESASAPDSEPEEGTSNRVATGLSPVGVHCSATIRTSGVLLPVVRAMASGENGRKRTVNCLLDSGFERSLIRTDIANELGLQGTPSSMTVRGVHGLSATVADSRHVRFLLGPMHEKVTDSESMKLELTALCIPSICDDLVASPTPWPSEIDLPPAAALASPPSPTPIHVLIGFDMYYRVLGRGLRISGEDGPIALETIFGWILCGPKAHCPAGRQETTLVSTATADRPAETTEELISLMRKFWEIDSIGVTQETAVDPNEETMEKFGRAAAGKPRSRPATLESTATPVGQERGHGEGIRGRHPDLSRQWMGGAGGGDRWSAWADVVPAPPRSLPAGPIENQMP